MSTTELQTGSAVALGELSALEGYALAGVRVVEAESDDEVRQRWSSLGAGGGVVILTPRSAAVLGSETDGPHAPMVVVLPA